MPGNSCGRNVSPGYLKFFLGPVIRYSYVDIGMYRYIRIVHALYACY